MTAPAQQPRPHEAPAPAPAAAPATDPGSVATAAPPEPAPSATGRAPAGELTGPTVLTGRAGRATDAATATATGAPAARAAALADAAVVPPWAEAAAAAARPPGTRAPGWLPAGASRWRMVLLLAQVALWQVALVLLLTVWDRPLGTAIALGALAVVLVALTAVRLRGRWLYQWLFAAIGYGCRRHRHERAAGTAPAHGLLDVTSPGARIESVTAGSAELGVVNHAGGATAVFVPTPLDQPAMFGTTSQALPAVADLLPPYDADGPSVTVQLVMTVVPPPTATVTNARAAGSYLQLTGNRVPVRQHGWVAVQVQRDATHLNDETLRTALRNTTRRLLRRLTKEGQPLDPVPADNLLSVVGTIGAVPARPPRTVYSPDPAARVEVFRERWSSWRAGGAEHTVLGVHQLGERVETLVAELVAVPAAAVTVSIAARRAGARVETEAVVGLMAPDRRSVRAAARAASAVANQHGAALSRLDGYQRRAAANLVPLGGFLPW